MAPGALETVVVLPPCDRLGRAPGPAPVRVVVVEDANLVVRTEEHDRHIGPRRRAVIEPRLIVPVARHDVGGVLQVDELGPGQQHRVDVTAPHRE
jgi:hypothetical protein